MSFILTKTSPIYLYLFLSILFLFQGLNLLQLAAHLEHKAAKPKEVSNLATPDLVFPIKSILLIIVGIPDNLLPLHGPQVQSHYHCQVPQCGLDFSQKAATCNHVCHDHLNVALACLYCSFENNPHMRWYSATAWESHTAKHHNENLPIYPDDPEFIQQFQATPSTSRQPLPHEEEIRQ